MESMDVLKAGIELLTRKLLASLSSRLMTVAILRRFYVSTYHIKTRNNHS